MQRGKCQENDGSSGIITTLESPGSGRHSIISGEEFVELFLLPCAVKVKKVLGRESLWTIIESLKRD